jgi:hypothetical protein
MDEQEREHKHWFEIYFKLLMTATDQHPSTRTPEQRDVVDKWLVAMERHGCKRAQLMSRQPCKTH